MPNVTLYLPDDQHEYAKAHELRLSALLQDAIAADQARTDPLESKFRAELLAYRNDPERESEWRRLEPGYPFSPCPACGTGMDDAEGCMAVFEPYKAAAVALLAHEPAGLRRDSLRAWASGGYAYVAMG